MQNLIKVRLLLGWQTELSTKAVCEAPNRYNQTHGDVVPACLRHDSQPANATI
jgi:hypothetical protein